MILLDLTPREWAVLVELCRDGADNHRISRRLSVTPNTVKTHVQSIMDKGGFLNRTELAVAVLRWDVALATRIPPTLAHRPCSAERRSVESRA